MEASALLGQVNCIEHGSRYAHMILAHGGYVNRIRIYGGIVYTFTPGSL